MLWYCVGAWLFIQHSVSRATKWILIKFGIWGEASEHYWANLIRSMKLNLNIIRNVQHIVQMPLSCTSSIWYISVCSLRGNCLAVSVTFVGIQNHKEHVNCPNWIVGSLMALCGCLCFLSHWPVTNFQVQTEWDLWSRLRPSPVPGVDSVPVGGEQPRAVGNTCRQAEVLPAAKHLKICYRSVATWHHQRKSVPRPASVSEARGPCSGEYKYMSSCPHRAVMYRKYYLATGFSVICC